jgi:ribose 5-phosphate isomerase A
MPGQLAPADAAKYAAARRAAAFVENGMRVGLGTGSTAVWLVRLLGERVAREGLRITGVPTSTRTAELARAVGVPLTTLDDTGRLDLTIDGADEIDRSLTLIKGGGGALLREKIVAAASDRMVVIADRGKEVETLGAFPLPVEAVPFGLGATTELVARALAAADVDGREAILRMEGGTPFVTDEGNRILDLHLGRIGDAPGLARALNAIPGVVETGLFVGICDTVVIGESEGRVEVRRRGAGGSERDVVALDGAEDLPG